MVRWEHVSVWEHTLTQHQSGSPSVHSWVSLTLPLLRLLHQRASSLFKSVEFPQLLQFNPPLAGDSDRGEPCHFLFWLRNGKHIFFVPVNLWMVSFFFYIYSVYTVQSVFKQKLKMYLLPVVWISLLESCLLCHILLLHWNIALSTIIWQLQWRDTSQFKTFAESIYYEGSLKNVTAPCFSAFIDSSALIRLYSLSFFFCVYSHKL